MLPASLSTAPARGGAGAIKSRSTSSKPAKQGLPFELVAQIDWETAVAVEDTRKDYGERRLRVLAFLGERLHAAVITMRGDAMHVISFRKANEKEARWYEKQEG